MSVRDAGRYILIVIALILLLALIPSCPSGKSSQTGQSDAQPSQSSTQKSEVFPGDPSANPKPGIQNCHGYTWWMLTGVPVNAKSPIELSTELTRRGYRPYVYADNITIKSGDVLIFENGLDHSGVVIGDGTLSHYRITQVQGIFQDTGNLPEGTKAGDLMSSKTGIITDPERLGSYPNEYEDWLISHSPDREVTRQAIVRKKAERSFGFWHTGDTMEQVKTLLFPDKTPTITVWKLPSGIEVLPTSDKIFQDEERTFEAWFVFDMGGIKNKIATGSHPGVQVYWHKPGETEVVRNGLVKGSDMKIGMNDINLSARIITPWGLMNDTIKPEYAGKDVDKWLETKARLTVMGIDEKPLSKLQLIQQTTKIFTGIKGTTTSLDTTGRLSTSDQANLSVSSEPGAAIWNGTSFSCIYQGKPGSSSSTIDLEITGEVSPEADLLHSIKARIIYNDDNKDQREYAISVVNVPLNTKSTVPAVRDPLYRPVFIGYIEWQSVGQHVTSTKMETFQPRIAPDYRSWYDPFKWDSAEHTPYLLIVFSTEHISIYDDPGYNTRK